MDRRTAVKNIALSLGIAVSGTTIINVFNACSSETTAVKSALFTPSDLKSMDMLADIILPVTTTKGAKHFNMSRFIDKMCSHVFDEPKQQKIKRGAEEFSDRFYKMTGKKPSKGNKANFEHVLSTYFDIPKDQEIAVFELIDTDYDKLSDQLKPDYELYLFLTTIRELSLLGYFTSQVILEGQLDA